MSASRAIRWHSMCAFGAGRSLHYAFQWNCRQGRSGCNSTSVWAKPLLFNERNVELVPFYKINKVGTSINFCWKTTTFWSLKSRFKCFPVRGYLGSRNKCCFQTWQRNFNVCPYLKSAGQQSTISTRSSWRSQPLAGSSSTGSLNSSPFQVFLSSIST